MLITRIRKGVSYFFNLERRIIVTILLWIFIGWLLFSFIMGGIYYKFINKIEDNRISNIITFFILEKKDIKSDINSNNIEKYKSILNKIRIIFNVDVNIYYYDKARNKYNYFIGTSKEDFFSHYNIKSIITKKLVFRNIRIQSNEYNCFLFPMSSLDKNMNGILEIREDISYYMLIKKKLVKAFTITGVIIFIFLSLFLILIIRKNLSPLSLITREMNKILRGELSDRKFQINYIYNDEIKNLIEGFKKIEEYIKIIIAQAEAIANEELNKDILKKTLPGTIGKSFRRMIERLEKIKELARLLSSGDLTHNIFSNDNPDTISGNLNIMIRNLRGIISNIKSISDEVLFKYSDVKKLFEKIKDINGKQSEEITEIATAIEESNISIQNIHYYVTDIANKSEEAIKVIPVVKGNFNTTKERLSEIKNENLNFLSRIEKLQKEADNINRIISLVNNISNRINLLSVSALTEALKYRSKGRGFIVIADEIKSFSQEITEYTNKIIYITQSFNESVSNLYGYATDTYKIIENNINIISDSLKSIDNIINLINSIANSMMKINESISEQTATSEELTTTIENIVISSQNTYHETVKLRDEFDRFYNLILNLREMIDKFNI